METKRVQVKAKQGKVLTLYENTHPANEYVAHCDKNLLF